MKTLAQMIDDVIRREGGGTYVNHPKDKGGPTKWGITLATLAAWRELPTTSHDVRKLTKTEARAIYEARYYREPGIDKLPPSIQPFMFDSMVNHRPKDAIRLLQGVLLDAGYDPGPLDGVVGPRTIGAANHYDRQFLDQLIERRRLLYEGIVARNPSQEVFLAGWRNRLKEFMA